MLEGIVVHRKENFGFISYQVPRSTGEFVTRRVFFQLGAVKDGAGYCEDLPVGTQVIFSLTGPDQRPQAVNIRLAPVAT